MKKVIKSIVFIFVSIFTLLLNIQVEAEGFSDSTGGLKPGYSGGHCPECAWVYNSDYNVGLRLGLYKYEGGQKTYYGSIDLYNHNVEKTFWVLKAPGQKSRLEYSSPSAVSIDKKNLLEIKMEPVTKYNGGNCRHQRSGYCYEINDPSTKYSWANEFVRDMSTWFGSDKTLIKKKVDEMFGVNMDLEEADNYYIVVETTFMAYNRVRSGIKAYGTGFELTAARETLNDSYFTDTYTESGEPFTYDWDFWDSLGNFVRNNVYNALFIKSDITKMYNPSKGIYDSNNFVNHNTGQGSLLVASQNNNAGVPDKTSLTTSSSSLYYGQSNFPYGITVLWLGELTGARTCTIYCADASDKGNCAETFCSNAGDVDACKQTCFEAVKASPGCDVKNHNICYNDALKTTDIKSEGNFCASSGKTTTQELTSGICYDDVVDDKYTLSGATVTVDKTGELATVHEYDPVVLSYYKIECEEKVKFTNLPQRTSVHVSSSLGAKLYAGYTMDYTKVCQIYYKTSDEKWDKDYTKSKAREELTKYQERLTAVNDLIAKLEKDKKNTTDQEKLKKIEASLKSLNTAKPVLQDIVKELRDVKTEADARLKSVKDKDQSSNSDLINQIEIEVTNTSATSSTKHTLTLEPAYCIANDNKTTETYCDLETKKEFTVTTSNNNVTCTDKNGVDIKAVVNNGTSTYKEKVYYALPSSYTGINAVGAEVVCHTKACKEGLTSAFEVKNAWVFDPLSGDVTLETYNNATSNEDLVLRVKGMGSCGQFSYELKCGYEFESSKLCTDECIDKYNDPNSEMTEEEYNACFKKYCSCDSYCGSNVACRMKYCPQECEGCEDLDITEKSCSENSCIDACNKTYADHEDRLTCRYGCCRTGCNGEEGCIYNCCKSECDIKRENNYITAEEHKQCVKMCGCENGSCPGRDYIYRTINLKRPFPNGDNPDGRTPGANWFGKVEYITESRQDASKYYDATDGVSEEYEYRFFLSSENIKEIKNNEDINLTYTNFKESKDARNTYEDATKTKPIDQRADVYCSYVIHDYFKSIGIEATSNARKAQNKYVVGSGCYTR